MSSIILNYFTTESTEDTEKGELTTKNSKETKNGGEGNSQDIQDEAGWGRIRNQIKRVHA